MELDFDFHQDVRPIFNQVMKVRVNYTSNSTHFYDSEFTIKLNYIPLGNDTVALVEYLEMPGKVLKFVVNYGWLCGILSLFGGIYTNFIFLVTMVNFWCRLF